MKYRSIFTSHYLRIELYSNSRRVCQLIQDFLDFNPRPYFSKHQIKIRYDIKEIYPRPKNIQRKLLYLNKLSENGHLLSSMGEGFVSTSVDPKARVVRASISGDNELLKENIIDFVLARPLHFILAKHGLFFLHASAVAKGQACMLISGPQNSGKSTLAFLLSQNGFDYFSDDDCFIKLKGDQARVFSFPTKIGINPKILKKYPNFRKYALRNSVYGGKRRISAKSVTVQAAHKDLQCRIILFPQYRTRGNIRIRKISHQDSLNRLIRANGEVHSGLNFQNKFWVFYQLAKNAASYELIYNDKHWETIPAILSKLTAR